MTVHWKYLPIVKWKQGERIALRQLSALQWQDVVSAVELPAVKAAPEAAALRTALGPYVAKIAKEFNVTFPEATPVLVDTRHVSPGYGRQVHLLQNVCKRLQKLSERRVIPVLTETMVAGATSDMSDLAPFDAHALRIQTSLVSPNQIQPLVAATVAAGLRKRTLHLIVDQYSLTEANEASSSAQVRPYLDAAIAANCASVTVAGGSFPLNLIGFKQGIIDIPRIEWQIWRSLRKSDRYAALRYGDYAVTNPAPQPDVDPKMVNPSVAIRYTTTGAWRLFKGGGFKRGKPDQYKNLCTLLISDPVYSGATFSYGDDCYDKAANAKLGNGNPSSWRRDATSHHLVFVATQL